MWVFPSCLSLPTCNITCYFSCVKHLTVDWIVKPSALFDNCLVILRSIANQSSLRNNENAYYLFQRNTTKICWEVVIAMGLRSHKYDNARPHVTIGGITTNRSPLERGRQGRRRRGKTTPKINFLIWNENEANSVLLGASCISKKF